MAEISVRDLDGAYPSTRRTLLEGSRGCNSRSSARSSGWYQLQGSGFRRARRRQHGKKSRTKATPMAAVISVAAGPDSHQTLPKAMRLATPAHQKPGRFRMTRRYAWKLGHGTTT